MAMAAGNTSTSIIGLQLTKKQGKVVCWIGGNSCPGTGFDCASEYISPIGYNSVRFVRSGTASLTSHCPNLAGGSGILVLQGRGNKRWDFDKRWRCMGDNEGVSSDENGREEGSKGENDGDEMLNLDGQIPTTSDSFLKQISSHGYDLRRQLEQNIESSSYAVLESNPWRETPKPVYVLAQEEDRLLTMRTRRSQSEVERELGILFPKQGRRHGRQLRPCEKTQDGDSILSSGPDSGMRMLVEDVREGVLVFEDEDDATRYCSLLDGQGTGCAGVAELDASDVFAVCQKTQILAVFFRRGTTPPEPDRLQLNLKARKRSLEDEA